MSRIEKAIAKASLLRGEEPPPVAPVEKAQPERGRHYFDTANVDVKLRPTNPCLITNRSPSEAASEEYRKLKSVVFELTQERVFDNTLLVTSDLPGAGKTLTALNLALTMAGEYDHTVLLVDADLRKPMVDKYLGLEAKKGLLHYLTENCPLRECLVRTGIGKLVVLPAGGTVHNPAELLGSKRMRDLIAELKDRYPDRYVILDSTPVLPFAEASILGSLVDGILFVVRERQTRNRHLRDALAMLKPESILGLVYNDTDGGQLGGRYGYGYY